MVLATLRCPECSQHPAETSTSAVPTTVSSMLSSSSATNTTTSTSLRDALAAASQRQGTCSAAGDMARAGSRSLGMKVSNNLGRKGSRLQPPHAVGFSLEEAAPKVLHLGAVLRSWDHQLCYQMVGLSSLHLNGVCLNPFPLSRHILYLLQGII